MTKKTTRKVRGLAVTSMAFGAKWKRERERWGYGSRPEKREKRMDRPKGRKERKRERKRTSLGSAAEDWSGPGPCVRGRKGKKRRKGLVGSGKEAGLFWLLRHRTGPRERKKKWEGGGGAWVCVGWTERKELGVGYCWADSSSSFLNQLLVMTQSNFDSIFPLFLQAIYLFFKFVKFLENK